MQRTGCNCFSSIFYPRYIQYLVDGPFNHRYAFEIQMKKLLVSILLLLAPFNLNASKISQISLEELENRAQFIVLAKVVKVEKVDARDNVTIEIRKQLKGTVLPRKLINFWLTTRGGLKDFDPELEVGNSVVAFLVAVDGKYEKAYWGSVAVFSEANFR